MADAPFGWPWGPTLRAPLRWDPAAAACFWGLNGEESSASGLLGLNGEESMVRGGDTMCCVLLAANLTAGEVGAAAAGAGIMASCGGRS